MNDNILKLSKEDNKALAQALMNPSRPGLALTKAVKRYLEQIKSDQRK